MSAPIPAVGVVCLRGDEVLLIRRGQEPRLGEWSLPGGRIEFGERAEDAALRELFEETGVTAELAGLVDVVDGFFGDRHYVLIDYAARWRLRRARGRRRRGRGPLHAAAGGPGRRRVARDPADHHRDL
jgi:ADP-ribose pyrophosphatase YjhB (NUDIX family)